MLHQCTFNVILSLVNIMPAYKTFAHRFSSAPRPAHAKTMTAAVKTARKAWGGVELVVVQIAATQLWWAFPANGNLAQGVIATGAMQGAGEIIALSAWERVPAVALSDDPGALEIITDWHPRWIESAA